MLVPGYTPTPLPVSSHDTLPPLFHPPPPLFPPLIPPHPQLLSPSDIPPPPPPYPLPPTLPETLPQPPPLHNNNNNNNFRVSNIRVLNRSLIYNVCPEAALTFPSRHSSHSHLCRFYRSLN